MWVGGVNHEKVYFFHDVGSSDPLKAHLILDLAICSYLLFAYIRGCGPFVDYRRTRRIPLATGLCLHTGKTAIYICPNFLCNGAKEYHFQKM